MPFPCLCASTASLGLSRKPLVYRLLCELTPLSPPTLSTVLPAGPTLLALLLFLKVEGESSVYSVGAQQIQHPLETRWSLGTNHSIPSLRHRAPSWVSAAFDPWAELTI